MTSQTTEVVATDVLTVGTPTVQATTTQQIVAAARESRISILIVNAGAQIVTLGKSAAVTTATGIPLGIGQSFEDREYTGVIYAVTASGTADLRVWEVG